MSLSARVCAAMLASAATAVVAATVVTRWGMRWGSTPGERRAAMPGDDYADAGSDSRAVGGGRPGGESDRAPADQALPSRPTRGRRHRTAMTRAVSIAATPEDVWPWLAQLGRGAGWYSYDRLDNGGIGSARHIVSWIPEPQIGDAAAIGWLRHLEPGRALTWWVADTVFLGARARMATDIRLTGRDFGSRLVIRMSADAAGPTAVAAVTAFRIIDSIMAIRQLKGIKARVESFGARPVDPDAPETGRRDQYQLFEAIWASGESCGVPGREAAAEARCAAQRTLAVPPTSA